VLAGPRAAVETGALTGSAAWATLAIDMLPTMSAKTDVAAKMLRHDSERRVDERMGMPLK
jgi:hypothetical protein